MIASYFKAIATVLAVAILHRAYAVEAFVRGQELLRGATTLRSPGYFSSAASPDHAPLYPIAFASAFAHFSEGSYTRMLASQSAGESEEETAANQGSAVTRRELIARIAVQSGVPKVEVESIINSFLASIQEELQKGKKVYVSRLGTFSLRRRGPRTARNPRTGEQLDVGAATFPAFSFSRGLRDAVRDVVPIHSEESEDEDDQQDGHQEQPAKTGSRLFSWR